jgi:hypothetical protein
MKQLSTQETTLAAKIESVLLGGDLSRLSSEEKVSYINRVCESLGLNPLTKPFDIIRFQGKEVLYARRDCADQLREIHGVSIVSVSRERIDDLYVVTAKASDRSGRTDEAVGALTIKGLSGQDLANALMKAETKAKRRVTLSICGLGLLDETEIADSARAENEARAAEIQNKIEAPTSEPSFAAEDFFNIPEEIVATQPGDYIFKSGKYFKGKPLKELDVNRLREICGWYDRDGSKNPKTHPDVHEDIKETKAWLAFLGGERD